MPFDRNQLYQHHVAVPDVPVVYYIHPRIQREDPRVIRDYSVVKFEGLAMMTPPRQEFMSAEIMRQIGSDKVIKTLTLKNTPNP